MQTVSPKRRWTDKELMALPRDGRKYELLVKPEFFQGAPDLAVEVISPRESRRRLKQKLTEYFGNGTRLAWVVNPGDRTVSVYTSVEEVEILGATDHLGGGALLPGFVFPIKELFETSVG